jgi:hypothetical protein
MALCQITVMQKLYAIRKSIYVTFYISIQAMLWNPNLNRRNRNLAEPELECIMVPVPELDLDQKVLISTVSVLFLGNSAASDI